MHTEEEIGQAITAIDDIELDPRTIRSMLDLITSYKERRGQNEVELARVEALDQRNNTPMRNAATQLLIDIAEGTV